MHTLTHAHTPTPTYKQPHALQGKKTDRKTDGLTDGQALLATPTPTYTSTPTTHNLWVTPLEWGVEGVGIKTQNIS